MAHFEVGGRVIAIANHSQGIYKRGQVFPLDAIKKAHCKCRKFLLDIGKKTTSIATECPLCGSNSPANGVWWVGSNHFAPYDDSLSELTADDILNEQTVSI